MKTDRGQKGTVLKKYSSWSIVWRDENGKQRWKSGYKSKTEGRRALDEILKKMREAEPPKDGAAIPETFRQYSEHFMQTAKNRLKPKVWASYDSMLRARILPHFGDQMVAAITCAAVQIWFDKLQGDKKIKRKTINNHVVFLHRIFEAAMKADLVPANPCRKLDRLTVDDATERVIPTPEEVVKVFANLPRGYQAFLAVASVTGFRRAELLGLTWNDVDFKRSALRVSKSLQRVKRADLCAGTFRNVTRIGDSCLAWLPPKSKKSIRIVGVSVQVMGILRSEYERARPDDEAVTPVFSSAPGAPIDPDSVYDVLHAAQDAAGVKHWGLHGLRHLYSSLLIESGAPFKTVQKNLGHASSQTTLDIYTRQLNPQDQGSVDLISAKFPYVSAEGLSVSANPAESARLN